MALVCAVLNVSAQENWSVKVGAGLSSLAGSEADGAKSAFAYKIGLGYEFGISESFAIEPALMLSNKGFKVDGIDGAINRYFVELPILAAFKISLSDEMKLIINAGPYLGYGILGSDIEWYGYGTSNIFDEYKRFEAGAQVGVKVAFGCLEVGAEYNRAFTKAAAYYKQYTQGFGLTFGYKF